MAVLVVAELINTSLHANTAAVISAARAVDEVIYVLVLGEAVQKASEAAARISGVRKVIAVESATFKDAVAESLTPTILAYAKEATVVMAPASTFGKNVMPRVAAKLNCTQISDIIAVVGKNTFKRPIYAGNVWVTVQCDSPQKVITVRPTAFASAGEQPIAPIEQGQLHESKGGATFIGLEAHSTERPDLTTARIVVSGGRGLQNKANFVYLEQLADGLHAAVGATRAAVDAGYVPNDYQVGQTGKIVAPDLYVAIGISGATQHVAGIKDAKIIVAINTDPDAPIFEVADYGLVADGLEVLPQWIAQLKSS